MSKFYCAYDIFGRGDFCEEDYSEECHPSEEAAYDYTATKAADEWVSYGGLHGVGYDEEAREDLKSQGMSEQEIEDAEWEEAMESVAVSVLSEEEFNKYFPPRLDD